MWETFGLLGNPFELKAVEKEGLIPISTFVGRQADRLKLKDTIKTRDHSLSLIIGDKGAGKTSLSNTVRSDLFDDYFTLFTEVDTQSYWNSSDFIIQVISLLYEQEGLIQLYKGLPTKFTKTAKEIHKELKPLFIDENSGINIQATVPGGAGGGIGFTHGMKINRYTLSSIKVQFRKTINLILSNGYKGIILQFNNLDNLEMDPQKLSQLLGDLRDFLLTEKCHFLFLGNKIMEGCFKDNPKVGDCISTDIHLGSLRFDEVLQILKRRYDVFKIENRSVSPPVNDDAVEIIYKLYEGNIRHMFYSLDKAVVNYERILTPRLLSQIGVREINRILYSLASERIKERIEPRAIKILEYMIETNKEITNIELTKHFKIKNQNTSKYLKKLKDNNLVTSIDYGGREVYYKIVEEAKWLLLPPESGKQKSIID